MNIGELFNLDKKEIKDTDKKESPPNLRDGKCCATCLHGYCGYDSEVLCKKYDDVLCDGDICDDWRNRQ